MFENNVKNLYIGTAYGLEGHFQLRSMTCSFSREEEVTVIKVKEADAKEGTPAKFKCISDSFFFDKILEEVKAPKEEGITDLICVGDYYHQVGTKKLTKLLKKENELAFGKLEHQKRFF